MHFCLFFYIFFFGAVASFVPTDPAIWQSMIFGVVYYIAQKD